MWNWGHLRWALKCQLIQITLENVITYYCCCVTMWVFFFWHFEFRSVVSHLNCVGTRWPNWPLWPVCLVKQDLQTVSALPPWGPMIQLLQLCTSLWVSGRHWFWSNVHFLMIKKNVSKFCISSVCVCVFTGDSQPMDVCSVHHDDTFLSYSVSLLGYGFYGDVQTDSERKRWLGPARYDLSGMPPFSKLEWLRRRRRRWLGGPGASRRAHLLLLMMGKNRVYPRAH